MKRRISRRGRGANLLRRCRQLVITLAFLVVGFWLLDKLFPLPSFAKQQQFAQVITDRYGQPLRVFADDNGVWRYPTDRARVSPFYIEALLGYEDRWFYSHPGVNPLALLRAVWQWIQYGRPVSGGSTLTMQVARLLDPHDKTISGKVKQMFRAFQLEWHFSKEEILTLYLNHAPFGGTIEGVEAASYAYLGKSASDLSRAEAALLAVLPQSPSYLRPDRYPDRAQQARNKVLNRLRDLKVWSAESVADAKQEQVFAHYQGSPMVAPLLARRLHQVEGTRRVIQTTLDGGLQLELEQLVRDYSASLAASMSVAMLVVDNRNMEVLAYIGSADFSDPSRYGHVDMVTAQRSPGSTLKPFLFALALDQGIIHEQSMMLDVPADFNGYRPGNFVPGYSGIVSARSALQRSLNIPAVQLLDEVTPALFYSQLSQAGIQLSLPHNSTPNLAMILGGVGTSLEDLVSGFASFGRQGKVGRIRLHRDQAVDFVERPLMSEGAAWVTQNALREVALGASSEAFAVKREQTIAFKTGTSYGFRDAWVLAASANITVGIWVGRPDGTPEAENFGRNSAVPLLRSVLALLPADALAAPARPTTVSTATICWPLGRTASVQQPNWCYERKRAWLIDGTAPPSLRGPLLNDWASYLQNVQVNQAGKRVTPDCQAVHKTREIALWPRVAEPWLAKSQRSAALLPPWAENCQPRSQAAKIKVTGIQPDSEYYFKRGTTAQLQVQAQGAEGELHWFLNGRWLGKTFDEHEQLVELTASGPMRLSVIDMRGETSAIEFQSKFE
ncbi:MAG: penicillin-binding protein 1C [Gammaproteobacteria bacterium]|nr:penicillin-binding protein 1C [Gammaproteobacteria bacterium]NVK89360.1 penicillin-binding protein 1C [Gammaproteobacteria bacterium]